MSASEGIEHYFQLLEVEIGSDLSTIKSAYKDLCLIWHPDKHPERLKQKASQKLQEINEAYEQVQMFYKSCFISISSAICKFEFGDNKRSWIFAEDIEYEKLASVLEEIDINVNDIVAIADTTILTSYKCGTFFTQRGLISKNDSINRLLGDNKYDFIWWNDFFGAYEDRTLVIDDQGVKFEDKRFHWFLKSQAESLKFVKHLYLEYNESHHKA